MIKLIRNEINRKEKHTNYSYDKIVRSFIKTTYPIGEVQQEKITKKVKYT